MLEMKLHELEHEDRCGQDEDVPSVQKLEVHDGIGLDDASQDGRPKQKESRDEHPDLSTWRLSFTRTLSPESRSRALALESMGVRTVLTPQQVKRPSAEVRSISRTTRSSVMRFRPRSELMNGPMCHCYAVL